MAGWPWSWTFATEEWNVCLRLCILWTPPCQQTNPGAIKKTQRTESQAGAQPSSLCKPYRIESL